MKETTEQPLIVYCSVPDAEVGKTIASTLVREGLCACVNALPSVTSYYIYDNEFCEDGEELLLIKTHSSHFPALRSRIMQLHPYDVPEIIATEITAGNDAYMKWLHRALKPL